MMATLEIVVITGMSGSGKSVALHALEDAGYYCVDNLPPELLPAFVALEHRHHGNRLAIAMDVRSAASLPGLPRRLAQLQQHRQFVLCNRSGENRENALSPNHWDLDSYYLICELVTQNQGWAIVPEHIAGAQWFVEQITAVKTDFLSDILIEIGIVKRLDSPSSEITEWITEKMRHLINSHAV